MGQKMVITTMETLGFFCSLIESPESCEFLCCLKIAKPAAVYEYVASRKYC